jgi:hypothetical protein
MPHENHKRQKDSAAQGHLVPPNHPPLIGTALADDDFPPEVGHLLSQILGPGVELARLVDGAGRFNVVGSRVK